MESRTRHCAYASSDELIFTLSNWKWTPEHKRKPILDFKVCVCMAYNREAMNHISLTQISACDCESMHCKNSLTKKPRMNSV